MQQRVKHIGFGITLVLALIHALPERLAKGADEKFPKELLRNKIFLDSNSNSNDHSSRHPLTESSCLILKSPPKGPNNIEPEFNKFVTSIIQSLKNKADKDLHALFHPRLKIAQSFVDEIVAKVANNYGTPYDVSVYRILALNTVDGSPNAIKCEGDAITVYPLYGYPLQFSLWLQVQGSKEIARIFVQIVPTEQRWNIGGFHVQQWTHEGQDFEAWTNRALESLKFNAPLAAYIDYDIAAKLINGDRFYELDALGKIISARDNVMSKENWTKQISNVLKNRDISYSASLLITGGSALLLRLRVKEEISLEQIKKDCQNIVDEFGKQNWTKRLQGIRCSYLLPNEDPTKEGAIGGIFLPFTH